MKIIKATKSHINDFFNGIIMILLVKCFHVQIKLIMFEILG